MEKKLSSLKQKKKSALSKGGDLTKSFFENAGVKIETIVLQSKLFGQTKDYTCVANSLKMALDDKVISRSEDYLATALKTNKDGASILDIPEALYNSRLDDIIVQAKEDISFQKLSELVENGKKAIVSVGTKKLGKHALLVDSIENGRVIIRDPLPLNTGSSYTVSIDDFMKIFNKKAVLI